MKTTKYIKLYEEDIWHNDKKVVHWPNGKVREVKYYKDGALHREDGPAFIDYWKNGTKHFEKWYDGGVNHRDGDEPATVMYNENGGLEGQWWYVMGLMNRKNGPASILYKDGKVNHIRWYKDGDLHREDGPANIFYEEDGGIYEEWWMNGVMLTDKQIDKIKLNIELRKALDDIGLGDIS